MDLISSISSLFNEVNEVKQNLRDLLMRHNVLIDKLRRLFNETRFKPEERVEREGFDYLILKGVKLQQEGTQKLNNMNLTERLMVAANINRIKINLEKSVADLENAIQELKEKKEAGGSAMKKRETTVSIRESKVEEKKEPYQMPMTLQDPVVLAPTLQDDHQLPPPKYTFQMSMEVVGPASLLKAIPEPKLKSTRIQKVLEVENCNRSSMIYNFDRNFFLPVIEQMQKYNNQVNFISSKHTHFELILQTEEYEKSKEVEKEVEKGKEQHKQDSVVKRKSPFKSAKKVEEKGEESKEQDGDGVDQHGQEVFSSFPTTSEVKPLEDFDPQWKLLIRNYSGHKTYYRRNNSAFLAVEGDMQLLEGDEIVPLMLKPELKNPLVIFRINFGLYAHQ